MEMTKRESAAQLTKTIKRAMATLPPGEHLHVAAIIAQQNAEIVAMKRQIRKVVKYSNSGVDDYLPEWQRPVWRELILGLEEMVREPSP